MELLLSRFVVSNIRYGSSKPGPNASKFEVPPTSKIFENKHTNPNLFRITSSVSAIQLVIWCYLSYFALVELKPLTEEGEGNDRSSRLEGEGEVKSQGEREGGGESNVAYSETSQSISESEDSHQSSLLGRKGESTDQAPQAESSPKEVKESTEKERSVFFKWFMSSKWRLSLSLLSLSVGALFTMTAYIYPLRMVRTLTYIRPTQALRVVTYTPWGSTRQLEVPLVDVLCNTPEAQVARGQNVALKIKDHSLYFLLNTSAGPVDPMLRTLVLSRRRM